MIVATKIDTVTARQKLTARHAPYWHRIMQGQYIGYRKISDQAPGTWIARYRDVGTGKVSLNSLGALDTVTPSDQYDAAVKAADAWFSHRDGGGSAEALTVAHACARYVENLRSHGREKTAVDADARFKRWVYPNQKFSNTVLLKLTPGIVNDWRVKLAKTKAIPQDRSKEATKPRSASSLNRDMATLKARSALRASTSALCSSPSHNSPRHWPARGLAGPVVVLDFAHATGGARKAEAGPPPGAPREAMRSAALVAARAARFVI